MWVFWPPLPNLASSWSIGNFAPGGRDGQRGKPNVQFKVVDLRVLLDELDTLGNVALEVAQSSIQQLLLIGSKLTNWVNGLDTFWAQLDLGGEELNTLVLEQRAVDESGLDDTLLALSGLQQALSEASTSHSHGKGSRASAILGLDDLITTILDAVDQSIELLTGDFGVAGLGDQRNDGDTGVAANDGDVLISRVGSLDLGDEARGTDDIEGGDTEETLGVVDTLGLVDLGADWDGGVDLQGELEPAVQGKYHHTHTGLEMMRRFASGAASAAALARSRTIEALVLKRSMPRRQLGLFGSAVGSSVLLSLPSRVMPGFLGTPAGMRMTSAPVRAAFSPDGVGS